MWLFRLAAVNPPLPDVGEIKHGPYSPNAIRLGTARGGHMLSPPSWHSSSRPPNVRGRAQRGSSLATDTSTGESKWKPTSPVSSRRAGSAAFALASRPRVRGCRRLFLSPPFRSGCGVIQMNQKEPHQIRKFSAMWVCGHRSRGLFKLEKKVVPFIKALVSSARASIGRVAVGLDLLVCASILVGSAV
jgi:hypothetical protein